MGDSTKDLLLQVLSQDNHMAAFPPPGTENGPMARTLLKLKESVKGVPQQLDLASMSQTTQVFQMIQGLLQMIQQAGGNPASVGQGQMLFAKSNTSVANADPAQIAMAMNKQDLLEAVGNVTGMAAGLMTFLSPIDLNQINSLANGSITPGNGVLVTAPPTVLGGKNS